MKINPFIVDGPEHRVWETLMRDGVDKRVNVSTSDLALLVTEITGILGSKDLFASEMYRARNERTQHNNRQ